MARLAALLDGNHYQLVDHLAPLCHLLEMPLITDSSQINQMVDTYYPGVHCILLDPIQMTLSYLEENFDILFTSLFNAAHSLRQRLNRKLLFIFVPHGNSDKSMEIFERQTHTLIYGPQMASRMPPGIKTLTVGNYRRHYFETMQKPFPKSKKTILFAPSWETPDFNLYEKLIQTCPPDYHLIIKPHAIAEKRHYSSTIALNQRYPENFLIEMPAIYPLLAITDYYVGDRSSIGYDFLSFNRPLFFLTDENHPLHLAGHHIQGDLFKQIANHSDQKARDRNILYDSVFCKVNPETRKEILRVYSSM